METEHDAQAKQPGDMIFRSMDVTSRQSVADVVREAEARTGRIDVLVHVAGGVRGQVTNLSKTLRTRNGTLFPT